MATWHDLRDPHDPQLEELARKYNLHPLHIEDCRNRKQSAKVEQMNDYLFIVLKPIDMDAEFCLNIADLDFFVGLDWLITVQEEQCEVVAQALNRVGPIAEKLRPDEIFYRVMDAIVDSYQPLIDRVSDRIDEMEDRALSDPSPDMLEEIFDLKRVLIQMRRVIANTRDVVGHLLRNEFKLVRPDLAPFLRDVYDHLIRNLDMIEIHRDLLNGATELYLSSVANRTNQVMKVLTIFGTIATPALVITGVYGMNLKHLPFAESQHSWGIVLGIIALVSGLMLAILKRLRML
jgi:magnesium transporter